MCPESRFYFAQRMLFCVRFPLAALLNCPHCHPSKPRRNSFRYTRGGSMMRALIIVGWILLTLLAILFVLLLLLLFVRLRLWAEGENGTGRVTLQFGPLRLPLYPTAQTHKKNEKNAQK